MQKWSVVLGTMIVGVFLRLAWAQQPAAEPPVPLAQQQKAQQYLRIEYERCRNDVADIWTKGDAAEQRVKVLEEELRKTTEELTTLRSKVSEKPAN